MSMIGLGANAGFVNARDGVCVVRSGTRAAARILEALSGFEVRWPTRDLFMAFIARWKGRSDDAWSCRSFRLGTFWRGCASGSMIPVERHVIVASPSPPPLHSNHKLKVAQASSRDRKMNWRYRNYISIGQTRTRHIFNAS